eukprot:TRINITY_DN23661_c0_g1_i2.p1 TRINITY_DN23661_c0_g1~~TRINITY_DN23661_c0_g1_i2.p1  ORF type:complete len:243 (-),score=67.15 TRINITY_DN23661_c0_g1_i2:65-793(-)
MIRRPPRSTLSSSSAASDVYKRQYQQYAHQPQQMWAATQQSTPASPTPSTSFAPPSSYSNPRSRMNFAAIKNRGVNTPQTLHKVQEPPKPQEADAGPYPPTLEAYVKRCFLSCKSQLDREQMEKVLKDTISSLDKQSRCTRDWLAEPIPSLAQTPVAGANKRSRWGGEATPVNSPALSHPAMWGSVGKQLTKKQKKQQQAAKAAAKMLTPAEMALSLIHISEPTRLLSISYAVFCLKKKKNS